MNSLMQKFELTYNQLSELIRSSTVVISDFSPLAQSTIATKIESAIADGAGNSTRPTGSTGSTGPTEAVVEYLNGQDTAQLVDLVRMVAEPHMKWVIRIGGGNMPATEQIICLRAESGKKSAGIMFLRDQVLLYAYDSLNPFVDNLIAKYASKNEAVVANLIPPFCSLDEFICVLQAIDLYRRSLYTSLLAYEPQNEPGFSLDTFTTELAKSSASKDIRWLTACFASILPNAPINQIRMSPESLKILIDNGLCRMIEHKEKGLRGLAFTDAGKSLGVEFERTWMTSVGFELSVNTRAGRRMIERSFLAPTAAANHYVVVEETSDGIRVNHQTYLASQLQARLNGVLQEAWQLALSETETASEISPIQAEKVEVAAEAEAPVPPEAAAPTEPMQKFCSQCGYKLETGVRFCAKCGARV